VSSFALLLLDFVILMVIVIWPLPRNFPASDRGSGSLVIMTPPRQPSLLRCFTYFLAAFIGCIVVVGLRSPDIFGLYNTLVDDLANSALHQPALVSQFSATLVPVVPVTVLVMGVAIAIAFPAPPARRLVIVVNAVLALVVSAVTDAVLAIFTIDSGIPLGPIPIIRVLLHYFIAFLLLFRIAFTSFQLPKKTHVPLLRKGNLPDDLLLIFCLMAGIASVGAAATFLSNAFGSFALGRTVIVLAVPTYTLALTYSLLGIVRLLGTKRPNPTSERPPIEVIIPAFNEEAVIARLLRSIDAAAVRYEGPVHVVLCDDGSTDTTSAVAQHEMSNFVSATGEIVLGSHGGKSAALNLALAQCKQDYVFRVDADCELEEWCFVYSIPWFLRNSNVGLVGAFTLPKMPYTTWIDRMRMLEMITGFGFTRVCLATIDGVPCIPGTFTGFRRDLALQIGGFVDGMYGEDVDFTCSIARLGYRAVIDRRVLSYEDVPNTVRQLRVQRTRWNRGGTMTYARFTPFGCGFAGPRFWFTTSRAAGRRLTSPLGIAGLILTVTLALIRVSDKHNLFRLVLILLVAQVPIFLEKIIVATYYRKARYLPWLICWYPFVLLKNLFALEAFLSFIARPVQLPVFSRTPTPVPESIEPAGSGAPG
jgi:cellulose synthase/poly-beta-1,6-N-acetylglucosamine synthase-like glycosyltransferase